MKCHNCTRESKKEKISYLKDIVIPITLSLFGILGTLGGVLIANHQSSVNEKESRHYVYQTKIIEQRINIVDRAARIFGKSPGLQDTFNEYIKVIAKGDKLDKDATQQLTEAQGEFQSIIYLSTIYFGPKTREALKELGEAPGPWWQKPKEKQDNLVSAMASEINYDIK
ncbi:TPA: hypothetical protein ACUB6H_000061 [Enterobacter cloacae]